MAGGKPPAGGVELDRFHMDQLSNLRCPHDKDDIESPMPSRQGR
jgi:hypothetical protein